MSYDLQKRKEFVADVAVKMFLAYGNSAVDTVDFAIGLVDSLEAADEAPWMNEVKEETK